MSKPVLYTFGGSVWGAVAELAVAELYSDGSVELRAVNLVEGENFTPNFISLNPNATLPTLEAEGKIFTNTTDVVNYLVQHAPNAKSKAPSGKVTEVVHEEKYDPNFALLLSRSEEERVAKGAALPGIFLAGRQKALVQHASTPEATPFKSFYDAKIEGNGGLLAIYQDKVPAEVKKGFFAKSQAHFASIQAFILDDLPSYLPESGFIAGEAPGADDFHIAGWLTRIGAASGAQSTDGGDVLGAFEKSFGKKVDVKVEKYWNAWIERESWKKVYKDALH